MCLLCAVTFWCSAHASIGSFRKYSHRMPGWRDPSARNRLARAPGGTPRSKPWASAARAFWCDCSARASAPPRCRAIMLSSEIGSRRQRDDHRRAIGIAGSSHDSGSQLCNHRGELRTGKAAGQDVATLSDRVSVYARDKVKVALYALRDGRLGGFYLRVTRNGQTLEALPNRFRSRSHDRPDPDRPLIIPRFGILHPVPMSLLLTRVPLTLGMRSTATRSSH
jgi:hypothetical protein